MGGERGRFVRLICRSELFLSLPFASLFAFVMTHYSFFFIYTSILSFTFCLTVIRFEGEGTAPLGVTLL